MEAERGDFCQDLGDDWLENQGKEQPIQRVSLVESCSGEGDFVLKDQFSFRTIGGQDPLDDVREVLLHLPECCISVTHVLAVYQVYLQDSQTVISFL